MSMTAESLFSDELSVAVELLLSDELSDNSFVCDGWAMLPRLKLIASSLSEVCVVDEEALLQLD